MKEGDLHVSFQIINESTKKLWMKENYKVELEKLQLTLNCQSSVMQGHKLSLFNNVTVDIQGVTTTVSINS